MYNYTELLQKWQSLYEAVKKLDKNAKLEIGEKATEEEIAQLEAKIGFKLPPAFKAAITEIGKSFKYSYDFSDYNVPASLDGGFRLPYEGTFEWNISELEIYEPYDQDEIEEWAEDYPEHVERVNNLQLIWFGGSRYGDEDGGEYCFDVSATTEEKPVVSYRTGVDYVEEDACIPLANSFSDYLEKTLELHGLGQNNAMYYYELWYHFEDENTQHYIKWFSNFIYTNLNDISNDFDKFLNFANNRHKLDEQTLAVLQKWVDIIKAEKEISSCAYLDKLDKLFQFTMNREELEPPISEALHLYEKPILFEKLKEIIRARKTYIVDRPSKACDIIETHIGHYAKDWILSFWQNKKTWGHQRDWTYDGIIIEPYRLESLTKHCMDITWLEEIISTNDNDDKINKEIYRSQVKKWGQIFMCVKPNWETYVRWYERGDRYCDALASGICNPLSFGRNATYNLPPKEEFTRFLDGVKEKSPEFSTGMDKAINKIYKK
ncbi:MAG: SMI1/KNR4 family protein [Defluviitaleaceae bacterium]|nr:SMI1/KNR4 family protein [Defluviitaleaceae bacterium]